MSHEIPVFWFAVEESKLQRGMDSDQVLELVPSKEQLWMATSRNWWYQGLLEQLLPAYSAPVELNYLLHDLAMVPASRAENLAAAIRSLLEQIGQTPQMFIEASACGETPEAVRAAVEEAQVSQDFDDDCCLAFANFFSFLVSQAAALEEAGQSGKALAYVQPQPTRSEQTLDWN